MTNERWSSLPGGNWESVDAAQQWFREQRSRLGWSDRQLISAYGKVAFKSDLAIERGGGRLIQGPTVANMRRFQTDATAIPDWLYWIPLAISRWEAEQSSDWSPWEWEEKYIPAHTELRIAEERCADAYRQTATTDEEIELLSLFRRLDADDRMMVLSVAHMGKKFSRWLVDMNQTRGFQIPGSGGDEQIGP